MSKLIVIQASSVNRNFNQIYFQISYSVDGSAVCYLITEFRFQFNSFTLNRANSTSKISRFFMKNTFSVNLMKNFTSVIFFMYFSSFIFCPQYRHLLSDYTITETIQQSNKKNSFDLKIREKFKYILLQYLSNDTSYNQMIFKIFFTSMLWIFFRRKISPTFSGSSVFTFTFHKYTKNSKISNFNIKLNMILE